MSDDKTSTSAVVKEDDGFVRIKLDAPVGSVISQPIQDSNQPDDYQIQAAAPPVPPPFMLPLDIDVPQVATNMAKQIEQVSREEQQAKQATQQALESVKRSEEEAARMQLKLKEQVEHAQKQVEKAKKQIQEAQSKQQETQKKLQENSSSSTDFFSIAGYKPGEIAQAFTKPPQQVSSVSPPSPVLDKKTEQQIKEQSQKIQQQVKATKAQIKQADKQIATAQKNAQHTEKKQTSMINKIAQTIKKMTDGEPDGRPDTKPHSAFMILGSVFMVMALLTLVIAKSFVWLLIAVVAIVQLGMGTILKRQN